MKVNFDPSLKVAGIALTPWTRLGPEQWLPNYAIASLYGWDVPADQSMPSVYSLLHDPKMKHNLTKLNTPSLLASEQFRGLLETKLPNYALLTYKPVVPPPELANWQFLGAPPKLSDQFENKVRFREQFKDILPIPEFRVYSRADLPTNEPGFMELLAGRSGIVIQDEILSGGKGTYLVSTYEQYHLAITQLESLPPQRRVIVSSLIEGTRERSLQGCITSHGVFVGPLQRQIVRHPALVDNNSRSDKFCGVVISQPDQDTPEYMEAKSLLHKLAKVMQQAGYKGIFGVDFLLDKNSKLYVIEVNARLTGATPLLTALYSGENGIPFYLLHILELAGASYTIENSDVVFEGSGSLMLLHSLEKTVCKITSLPASGTYRAAEDKLQPISRNINLNKLESGEFIIQEYVPPGMPINPGGRLVCLQFREEVIDKNTEELYNIAVKTIEAVRSNIKLEASE